MLIATCGSDSSSRRDKVVLPAPDGEDSTSIKPRRCISLDILGLLAELVDHCLQRQPDPRQCAIGGFGTKRFGFAVEFLGQEIEFAAHRLAAFEQRARVMDMPLEPVQ